MAGGKLEFRGFTGCLKFRETESFGFETCLYEIIVVACECEKHRPVVFPENIEEVFDFAGLEREEMRVDELHDIVIPE